MKVTLNWIKQYTDFDWSPEQLADRLTMLGIEVEGVQKMGGEFEGIVVAEVLQSQPHPNADRLSVCRVADGQGERQIVCGAKNFKVGDKVPLIRPGYSLPAQAGQAPAAIKAGKIRGVESQGMMCSPKELGLAEDADGLLILSREAKVGQAFAEHLGRAESDVIYDLEITPNRPDLNSVLGIAREISALTGNPLRIPEIQGPAADSPEQSASSPPGSIEQWLAIRLDDPELCPRYVARVVQGVKVGPSPDWLRTTLEKVGVRSINNVVDVTNYVMLETGQPLHAFDYHLLGRAPGAAHPLIVVRRAAGSETFTTLDGQERSLTSDMLLIADETKAIALAGIMGGQNSEINGQTADVLIESAYFKPQNIRATSKRLELRTESSYRFERGGDPGITDWASRRAAELILNTAGGTLVRGHLDENPKPAPPRTVALRPSKVDELLGVTIPPEQQSRYLSALGLEPAAASEAGKGPSQAFRIPTFRVDLKREIDLIEEVCRLYGVEKIPATPPRGAIGSNAFDTVHDELSEARRLLSGLGLNEAQGQTLISDQAAAALTFEQAEADLVKLENPLSSDMNVLRPSLLPGLVEALKRNLHHKSGDVAMFEIGRVFRKSSGQFRETRQLAVALTGHRHPAYWMGEERNAKWEILDLKGLLEEFLEQFGVRGVSYARHQSPKAPFIESASLQLGKFGIGCLGQLHPALAKQHDLRDAVLLAEIDLEQILCKRNTQKSFKALPAFPAVRRDVALLVPETITHEAVLAAVKQAKPQFMESVDLFDVFRGGNIPSGQKSVAYAFTYRNPERTLTDNEVNALHEKLASQLCERLGAVIR